MRIAICYLAGLLVVLVVLWENQSSMMASIVSSFLGTRRVGGALFLEYKIVLPFCQVDYRSVWNPESSHWNPESTERNPESKTLLDSFTWREKFAALPSFIGDLQLRNSSIVFGNRFVL